jgi:hypothetical protein
MAGCHDLHCLVLVLFPLPGGIHIEPELWVGVCVMSDDEDSAHSEPTTVVTYIHST